MTYTSQLFWGEESLIAQCVENGQQKIRGDGIIQYSMQHTGGIFFVYKNESTELILKEDRDVLRQLLTTQKVIVTKNDSEYFGQPRTKAAKVSLKNR